MTKQIDSMGFQDMQFSDEWCNLMSMCTFSSWYRVDYSQSEEFRWGKDLGCQFVQHSCLEWIEGQRERFVFSSTCYSIIQCSLFFELECC